MLMHLDLDINHRFGLMYVINTMVEKEKCVHRILLCIHWNIVSNETFLFKSRLISSIFILHQLKKKKEKERALILSLFVQSNEAKKVGFFSIPPSDRQINWSARERTGQIILSLLHFSARAVSIPLSSPPPPSSPPPLLAQPLSN